ncbi:MAG TPA: heparan-alpha-glucosaminide N-acetyltransferase [Methanocorpusculum sp.]|nr:heparan-alpha-glucosaminide N-acetyltransferase [Methanocorpusculum sp.]
MGRYFEIDAFRGIALIFMIIYHILYCLSAFTPYAPWFGSVSASSIPIASAFIGIAGLSLVLAKRPVKRYLQRGIQLILFGLVITVVTWIFYPSGFVVFGVLSLIGLGTILAIPFLSEKIPWYAIAGIGTVIVLLNLVVSQVYLSIPYLLPLGFKYSGFVSVDYEPLIPWFGVMLIGLAIGKLLYPAGKRIAALEKLGDGPKVLAPVCFLGRHTLIIYLVHVPLILACLVLTGIIPVSTFI